ncbi:MAG: hypothetical protein J6W84_04185 [Bacteroidales bacterium]|nr:hypothetical protein [Bacteroidales bacterium]MBQ7489336.1 hypothetical protein [Bacteroidales bacterium]
MDLENLKVGTRVEHPKYGEGIISQNNALSYKIIFVRGGEVEFSKLNLQLEVVSDNEEGEENYPQMTIRDIEKMLKHVLNKYNGLENKVELGKKWIGGTMILQPANPDLKPKEMPVETFFHKIVMMRDRLRVLEQNINSSDSLTDEEKVNLQQYITRIYGSMTSFNILFENKEDYFVGAK